MPVVQHIESGYPDAYFKMYVEKDFQSRDPTVRHVLASEDLLVWDEKMYSEDSYEIMEESKRHKLGYGMSVPVHEGPNVRSVLSLARDMPIVCPREKGQLEDGARVLAQCVHVGMSRLLKPVLSDAVRPKLTPRELECLQWAALGKSAGVTADLLKVSESVVKFHLKNVFGKLGVSSKSRAVAVGVSLGLVA